MILTGGRRCKGLLWSEFFVMEDPYGFRSCGPIDTVIDLGAHCGMFTLMSRFLMPKARVISVEPDQGNFKALTSNALNLHIELHNLAVADGLPVALLNRHVKTVSMCYDHTHDSSTSGVFDHPDPLDTGIAPNVPSAKFEDLWAQWNPTGRVFLKMDTEGSESYMINNPAVERCLDSLVAMGAEIHAHRDGPSLADYRKWFEGRFGSAFDVQFVPWHRARTRLAQLRMRRK